MLQKLEQIHLSDFIIGEVKNSYKNIGVFGESFPPIMYILYHSPHPILILIMYQTHNIYFKNEPLDLLWWDM